MYKQSTPYLQRLSSLRQVHGHLAAGQMRRAARPGPSRHRPQARAAELIRRPELAGGAPPRACFRAGDAEGMGHEGEHGEVQALLGMQRQAQEAGPRGRPKGQVLVA